LTVFIADDSKPVADMLTELIAVPGRIEVVGVADCESTAVESIRRLKPGVVVLDLQLKSGSGTGVIRAVRASAELRATRIIVISNHALPHMRAACLELGADEYYDKLKELPALTAKLAEIAAATRKP
jgi:CheY-like chemotaxis protein